MATESRNLTIKKVDTITKTKSEFRKDLGQERRLRELNQAHLSYLHTAKLWNVGNKEAWKSRTNEKGQTEYFHFYKNHPLVITQEGPSENPVVTVESSDESGNTISMHLSTEAFGISEIGIVIGCLAAATHIAFNAESVGAAMAAAGAVLSGEEGAAVEITLAGAGGPIAIALGIMSFIIILAMFLSERDITMDVRYENRSASKQIKLLKCWTWNLPNIDEAVLEPLHQPMPGFDVYDVAVYEHHNDRKTEGIGLSLLFQSEEGYANICIRNDIHKNPSFGVRTGPAVDPEAFYYNMPASQINTDYSWGGLTIKSLFKEDEFNDYKFKGFISFTDV